MSDELRDKAIAFLSSSDDVPRFLGLAVPIEAFLDMDVRSVEAGDEFVVDGCTIRDNYVFLRLRKKGRPPCRFWWTST